MKLQLIKLFLFLAVFALLPIAATNASYFDSEISGDNSASSITLDFDLTGNDFNEDALMPQDNPAITLSMSQTGILNFNYSVKFIKTGGNDLLCDNLILTAKRDSIPIYQGSLSAINLTSIPFSSSNQWNFDISVPNNPDYQLLSCDFDIVFSSDDLGFYDTEFVSNHINTGDWTIPEANLGITGSWVKIVSEKIVNGDFDDGLNGWTTHGDVSVVNSTSAQIGSDSDPGNYTWENQLMQSFPSGAKNLSLFYNFYTYDFALFDDPGFLIRLNGNQVFTLNTEDANIADEMDYNLFSTGWNQAIFDLSGFTTQNIELSINAGNTLGKDFPSWVQVDHISTWFIAAPAYATYNLTGSEDIDHFVCLVDGEDCEWIDESQTKFKITTSGTHIIDYYAVDKFGNESDNYQITLITDDIPPAKTEDLMADYSTENSVFLSWTAPGNDGTENQASKYEIRYQKDCTNPTDFNFYQANKFEGVPSPKKPLNLETIEITGLTPSTYYCFALKTADEAPNWSKVSNVVIERTLNPTSYVHQGDIVINELMWMGSSISSADEWLELRNMTDHDINLDLIYLTEFNGMVESLLDIDLTGKTIPAKGYFLIANGNKYTKNSVSYESQLKVDPDIWDASLNLDEDNLQIALYYQLDIEKDFINDIMLDQAWDKSKATLGLNQDSKYYSMERVGVPGNGTNLLSWYTSLDPSTTEKYFDGNADERGTPKDKNSSQEESASYTPEIILSIEGQNAHFTAHHVAEFVSLNYLLSYDTDTVAQAILGSQAISKDTFDVGPLYLGTCSTTEGVVCTPHPNPHNFVLQVKLEDINGNIINLTTSQ